MSTPHPDEFTGLAALVTGGASGIGLATARLLASRGAQVAILDREIPAHGGGTSGGIQGDYPPGNSHQASGPFGSGPLDGSLMPVIADVTDDPGVRSAVTAATEAFGGLDILVNNAGIGAAGTIESNDDAEWRRVMDVNVLGIMRTSRAALPALRAAAAPARPGRDRQHQLDRGHRRAAAARPVLGDQGRDLLADPGHGR